MSAQGKRIMLSGLVHGGAVVLLIAIPGTLRFVRPVSVLLLAAFTYAVFRLVRQTTAQPPTSGTS